MMAQRPMISGSTGPIFVTISATDRYLFVDNRSGPSFPIPQGMFPWQPILGKIGKMTIWQAGVLKQAGIWQF